MKKYLIVIFLFLLVSSLHAPFDGGFEDEFSRLFKIVGNNVVARRDGVTFGDSTHLITFIGTGTGDVWKDSSNIFTKPNTFIDSITGDHPVGERIDLLKLIQHIKIDTVGVGFVTCRGIQIEVEIDSLCGEETYNLQVFGIGAELDNYNPDSIYTMYGNRMWLNNYRGHTRLMTGNYINVVSAGWNAVDTPTVYQLSGTWSNVTNGYGGSYGGGIVEDAMVAYSAHWTNKDSVNNGYGIDLIFTFDTLSRTGSVIGANIRCNQPIKGTIHNDFRFLDIHAPTIGPTGSTGGDLYGIHIGDMTGATGENYSIKSLGSNYLAYAEVPDSLKLGDGEVLVKFKKLGTHCAIIMNAGADTVWAMADSL